jgi:hypothetical protein
MRKYAAAWVKEHHEEFLERSREYNSRPEVKARATLRYVDREYGHGAAEHFSKQIKLQKNKCAICKCCLLKPHRDHNHKTKKLRGVLCVGCNSGLGHVEKPRWLRKALAYLELWEKIQ